MFLFSVKEMVLALIMAREVAFDFLLPLVALVEISSSETCSSILPEDYH